MVKRSLKIKENKEKRVCSECHESIELNKKSVPIIKVLLILCKKDTIRMRDWKNLAIVSIPWYNAAMFLISRLNQILRYMSFQSLTEDEKILLCCNRFQLFAEHPRVLARIPNIVLSNSDSTNFLDKISIPIQMKVEEALEILLNYQKTAHKIIYSSAVEAIVRVPWSRLSMYGIALVQLPEYILEKILQRLQLHELFDYFYILRRFHTKLAGQILKSNTMLNLEVCKSDQLLSLFRNIAEVEVGSSSSRSFYQQWKSLQDGDLDFTRVPGMWNLKVVDVNWSHTIQKKSKTRPTIFTLVCKNKKGETKLHRVMLKKEDVLNDYVVQSCAKLLMHKSQRCMDPDSAVIYDVVPLNKEDGLVYIVPDCRTLYDIAKTFTIQNFLVEHNKSENVFFMRRRFVQSCAFSTILSFLMGTGDRHLNNILLTFDGRLFNIDFGFILGRETSHRVVSHSLKLTNEMLDALGGKHSSDFELFTSTCKQLFWTVRKHVLGFVLLLQVLVHHGDIEFETFKDHIISRFCTGESDKESELRVCTSIKRHSSEYFNTIETVYDTLYDWKQKFF